MLCPLSFNRLTPIYPSVDGNVANMAPGSDCPMEEGGALRETVIHGSDTALHRIQETSALSI